MDVNEESQGIYTVKMVGTELEVDSDGAEGQRKDEVAVVVLRKFYI